MRDSDEFVSGGAKNYAYRTRGFPDRNPPKPPKVECKVKGITLNVRGLQSVNFDSIKATVQNGLQGDPTTITTQNPSFFQRDVTHKRIQLTTREKRYNLVFDKRVVADNGRRSYPFGYSRTTDTDTQNIDMLLDLVD